MFLMAPLITVFTPTYNRATLLRRLYDSLLLQNFRDFEWLVLDDGSTDDTERIISSFLNEGKIKITYVKQKNSGKHTAINKGVAAAKGQLFFIVDSDDLLPANSLERIADVFNDVESNIAGIVGKRFILNKEEVNIRLHAEKFVSTLFDFRFKHHYKGDMAEVIRTSVMKKYPFPEFNGERFCTEALVWNRMSIKHKFLYFDQFIYNCEYQEGGLTSQYWQLLLDNPKGSLLYFKELLDFPLKKEQIKETVKAYNTIAKLNGCSKLQILKDLGVRNFLKIYC